MRDTREELLEIQLSQANQKIAEQAAVIEKLQEKLKDYPRLAHNTGFMHLQQFFEEVIAIPTDSKQVLQDWLDEVLGEPFAGYEKGSRPLQQMLRRNKMLLTHEEIDDLSREMVKGNKSVNWLCGKVISAYEAKLREEKPVAYSWIDGDSGEAMVIGASNYDDTKAKSLGIKAFPLYKHPTPIPEGWQQFSHTLKYLIGSSP